MTLHILFFAIYALLAGWAALGLPTWIESTETLLSALAGASVFLAAALVHVLYILRLDRQEQAYERDTVREAVRDALLQLEDVRRKHADLRAEVADVKHQRRAGDQKAAELLETEVLKNVLDKLEGLAGDANVVDGPKPDAVKARNQQ